MIRLSPIADDWVVKGCHLHYGPYELAIKPGSDGSIVVKHVFAGDEGVPSVLRAAAELRKELLESRENLEYAIERVTAARGYLIGRSPPARATAVSGEMHFLLAALRKALDELD